MSIKPTPADAFDAMHFPLDMDKVAAAAAGPDARTYELEFVCHGEPFNWTGKAISKALAEPTAVAELSAKFSGFNRYKARLVRCVEAS